MPRTALTGSRIRERRTMLGLKQADLARIAGISPSYLNLIEHNRRRIAGKLLGTIAQALSVDLSLLTQGAEAEHLAQLTEAAASLPDTNAEVDRIDEFIGRFPGWAGLVVGQQRRIAGLEQRVAGLADRLAHDPFLSASLHEVLSKVSAIQSTASILEETEDLDLVWQKRFHRNLHADSQKLAEGAASLVDYLETEGEPDLGMVSPQEELEASLNRTGFHVAALERALPDSIDRIIAHDPRLKSDAGKDRARAYLEQYRRDATQMPLAAFSDAAAAARYDPAVLSHRFGTDVLAVFRRLASLPEVAGVGRIGLVICDGAGALTLRKATELMPLPRFGAACALWPLYQAMSRPMAPVRAALEHAGRPGQPFLSYAISHPSYPGGFSGPAVFEAAMLILPPGLVEPDATVGVPQLVGTSCRVCPAVDCPARREPSVLSEGFDTR
ncbi:helix-turn-helix domain-containing protein [Pseudoruegeria sp. SK021]|uniref:helix-turn-helix domain-containing protein n=1 Tax=Pseudoruegeria sp. SK021 TaxID=1933035 RepID=UPI000A261860|nr:helix-turn-helix domain-containing protein [Pseudoruegeria sp. SK021]OSP54939.1 hypothetical protein BV911_09830 [Pseudoruegeria sp. SK021]